MTTKRNTPRPANITIYLGSGDDRERRLHNLDALAEKFGLTRSVFIQRLADQEFQVQPSPLERVRAGLEDIKAGRVTEIHSAHDIFHDE